MFAITGAFGQTGLVVSKALLAAGKPVRMIVRRDDAQARAWRAQGAEVVVADLGDALAMAAAFRGASHAYLLNPPAYTDPDLFARARQVHAALVEAVNTAGVGQVVALSSVGAHCAEGTGNILTTHDFEQRLDGVQGRLTILRAANFMENWSWSLKDVLRHGELRSMFKPVSRGWPMVSARDIGRVAAELLTTATPPGVVELHGPAPCSADDAAAALSVLLGRPIRAVEADEDEWCAHMAAVGFPDVSIRGLLDMFHGFNDGTVVFEGTHTTRYGATSLRDALAAVLDANDSVA